MTNLDSLEQKIGITFTSKELLLQAFTHRSYLNEHPGETTGHNERLEFLGDAVLELVVTDYLYRKFPTRPEGELTSIRAAVVNTNSLSFTAKEIDFNEFILLSRGEAKDSGKARDYILANIVEALIGAIYLDQGYTVAKDFVTTWLLKKVDTIVEQQLWLDPKSLFQEKSQELFGITPSYRVLKESGPDHDKHFVVGVFIGDRLSAEGKGSSKQEAEREAAGSGLRKEGWG